MAEPPANWLALDIGGANIKVAHTTGGARTLPFEMWKHPDDLSRTLATLAVSFAEADRVAVTMTAELCDCFVTKAEGVRKILDAVQDVFRKRLIRVWGVSGRFYSVEDVRDTPGVAAASNWVALATVAARMLPAGPGLLTDIGSTTTDLIPLRDGEPVPRGRTDPQRLQSGELVYAGVRRTPVCALGPELTWRGAPTGLAAELFATTQDVYLTLGAVPEDPTDLATANGRPATVEAARDRLARMVGADRDDFSTDDALALARAADEALMARLESSTDRACLATVGRPGGVVVAGSGSFLARRLAARVVEPGGPVIELDQVWGPVASAAACAHALLLLASEEGA